MAGAEAHRRLDDDGRWNVPRRGDDDAADLDCAKAGLRAGGPVFVGDVEGVEGQRGEALCQRLERARALGLILKEHAP
jgi:hypothetical protein